MAIGLLLYFYYLFHLIYGPLPITLFLLSVSFDLWPLAYYLFLFSVAIKMLLYTTSYPADVTAFFRKKLTK